MSVQIVMPSHAAQGLQGRAASWWTSRWSIYLACTLAAVLISFLEGKEAAWDTLDYHLYAGFNALHDRLQQDYFAAGAQSYLNPYIYVPFYLLVISGLPALAVASILAIVHSVLLWLAFELGLLVSPSSDWAKRRLCGLASVGMVLCNPILLQQIGSDFSDILTAEMALGALLLLMAGLRDCSSAKFLCAGLLFGAATGLKLTNGLHAVCAGFALLFLSGPILARIRQVASYAAGGVLAFAIVAGPWAYQLWRVFRNPVFPLLNNVFRSPEFITDRIVGYRFIPPTLLAALLRPFEIVNPVPMTQEEFRVPDLRYAVLCVIGIAAVATTVLSAIRKRQEGNNPHLIGSRIAADPAGQTSGRVLRAMGLVFVIDWALWLAGSGNGRYFLPMSCLAGVLIVGYLLRNLWAKMYAYVLFAIFLATAIQYWSGTDFRWNALPWDGPWFKVLVPPKLQRQPNLYLTIGTQSNSFLAAYLQRDSAFVNFSGNYSLGPEGVAGGKIARLMDRYGSNIKVLVGGSAIVAKGDWAEEPTESGLDSTLSRFGLRVDASECARIVVKGLPHPLWFTVKGHKLPPESPYDTYFLACSVIRHPEDAQLALQRDATASVILDHLEQSCPALFQPRGLRVDEMDSRSRRYYMNTDLAAWVGHGQVKFQDLVHHEATVYLGESSEWLSRPLHVNCGRRPNGQYFAQALGADGRPVAPPRGKSSGRDIG